MKKFLISSLAALLVMLALPVAGIFAASVTFQGQKNYCVEQLSPLQSGQLSSKVISTGCFATFSQSIAFATNGAVRLSAAATPKDLTVTQMRNASMHPFVDVVIGILYSDIGMQGSTDVITAAGPCTKQYSYGITSMATGWGNVVSSLESFQSCTFTTLYSATTYGGPPSKCYDGNSSDVGQMDNLTQSAIWGTTNPTPGTHAPSISCT